jgi:hypothetical protein
VTVALLTAVGVMIRGAATEFVVPILLAAAC